MADSPGGLFCAPPVDDCFWDKATIHEIDAMQSLPTFAACLSKSCRRRDGTSALPSEAENQHSSASDQIYGSTRGQTLHPAGAGVLFD
jgi:hypothetical protein